jgi:hypothetical protein
MRRPSARSLSLAVSLFGAVGCHTGDSGRVDATVLAHGASGPVLRVSVLGAPDDSRLPAVREAIAFWNGELPRLGRQLRLTLDSVRGDSVGDDLLRAASRETMSGGGPATDSVLATLSAIPADVVIALSRTDLISFSVPWRAGSHGVVGIRRSDVRPLSLPNTVRNVVAHELGHVLGLRHNSDSTTLMCGRPAPCRPAAFASDTVHFFPLTASDERRLRERWP